ncbi:3-oxoadipate enol-lactonase [Paracoccus sp. MBLB3053]|uniref:3-oxoadipate enol-lactonase n=1 Tax=Paracoccus aurantius TaxID=3073814 RepID=A0ABU2HVL3_9RHOB|nr:3-oxoadipate enol-lactonase [Paracoccus sp. MBLB3053]MDS9469088.1 3-oxoadipate enol-lactonase [Paracoccus sp. MBLB3053]
MQVLNRPWGAMHYRIDGPADGPVVVFANSLGTDLRLWDPLLAEMPGIRAVRFDKRGHGLSDEGGEFRVEDLADDAAALIEHLGLKQVVFVGLSIGGMIAQIISSRRADLVGAVVLANTAVKMGTQQSWDERIAAIRSGGLGSIVDLVMQRWFAPKFRAQPELAIWRNMVARTSASGYIAACHALSAAELTDAATRISLPAMVIAGEQDGSSPAELVKATADLVAGATFHVIPDAGHLPCVEQPAAFAALLGRFLKEHSA